MNLRLTHRAFCWFCGAPAHIFFWTQKCYSPIPDIMILGKLKGIQECCNTVQALNDLQWGALGYRHTETPDDFLNVVNTVRDYHQSCYYTPWIWLLKLYTQKKTKNSWSVIINTTFDLGQKIDVLFPETSQYFLWSVDRLKKFGDDFFT